MTENRWVRPLVLVSFCCTTVLGAPAFYVILGIVLCFYLSKPQAYLGLLFFSGSIKNAPLINHLPIDFTLLTYLLFIFYFVYQKINNRNVDKNIIPVGLILVCSFLIVLISLFTTAAPWSYVSKSGIFIVVLYLPLVLMIILLPVEQIKMNVRHLFTLSLFIGYLWIGLGLHNNLIGYTPPQQKDPTTLVEHISAFGEDYMAFSTFVVLIYLEAIIQFLFGKSKIVNGVLLVILTYVVANSPARGLTIGLILAVATLSGIALYTPTRERILAIISLPIGLALFIRVYLNLFLSSEKKIPLDRLTNFDPSGVSINHRLTSIQVGCEHWKDHMFFGTGVNSVAFFNNDSGYHAHNPVLEIIFEYGIVGGLPLLLFLIVSLFFFYHLLKSQFIQEQSSIELWLVGVFITFFTFGMFSGTLGEMRHLWILLGIAIALGVTRRKPWRGSTEI